jgi:hypothetical protein
MKRMVLSIGVYTVAFVASYAIGRVIGYGLGAIASDIVDHISD